MTSPLFDAAWALAVFLLWARIGALFAFSPIATAAKVPSSLLVLLSLAVAGLLVSAFGLRVQAPLTWMHFAMLLASELALGALLAFAMQCVFAAFVAAGRVLDVQMGFGLGALFDPVTRSNAPVVGSILALFGIALFFAVDGHHALMRGIAFSISAVPPGSFWELPSPAALLRPVGAMFSIGVAVAAPVLFVLLLAELALGVASRVLPQMNVFFVGLPAKILIGLAALAFSIPVIAPAMAKAYASIFEFWGLVLR